MDLGSHPQDTRTPQQYVTLAQVWHARDRVCVCISLPTVLILSGISEENMAVNDEKEIAGTTAALQKNVRNKTTAEEASSTKATEHNYSCYFCESKFKTLIVVIGNCTASLNGDANKI